MVMDEESQLATKEFVRAELAETKGDLRTDIAANRTEISSLRHEIAGTRDELRTEINANREDISTLRTEMHTGFAKLEGDMDRKFSHQLKWLIGAVFTALAVMTAVLGTLINVAG